MDLINLFIGAFIHAVKIWSNTLNAPFSVESIVDSVRDETCMMTVTSL